MDFGLSKYDLSVITRRIELPEVSADPAKPLTLIVRCADVRNRDFASNLFKLRPLPKAEADKPAGELPPAPDAAPPAETAALVPAPAPAPEVDPDEAARLGRERAATLFAGAVLVGWENAESGGKPVPFSLEAARELMLQLMEHVPDVWVIRVRRLVEDMANFRPGPPPIDPVDLGKG